MIMIIRNNINALTIYRQLNNQVNRSIHIKEKLSTGYQINHAADNVAGLTISEGMRGQIRGLSRASENAQDGLSLIQTADGGLSEVHSLIQRIRELSVQAVNDTYTDKDREAIQNEVEQLKSEIDRIANTTEFNTRILLDGTYENHLGPFTLVKASYEAEIDFSSAINGSSITLEGTTFEFDTDNSLDNASAIQVSISTADNAQTKANALKEAIEHSSLGSRFTIEATAVDNKKAKFVIQANEEINKQKIEFSYGKFKFPESNYDKDIAIPNTFLTIDHLDPAILGDGSTITIGNYIFEFDTDNQLNNSGAVKVNIKGADILGKRKAMEDAFKTIPDLYQGGMRDFTIAVSADNLYTINLFSFTGDLPSVEINDPKTAPSGIKSSNIISKTGQRPRFIKPNPLFLQVGANSDELLKVFLTGVTTNSLGIEELSVKNSEDAAIAIEMADNAINYVSTNRATLGATQNRLEHILRNLKVGEENLTATESSIRDTDIAKGMMQYYKGNIIQEVAQSILAQANNMPGTILRLLQ